MSGSHHILMGTPNAGGAGMEGQGGNDSGTYTQGGKNWQWHRFYTSGQFTCTEGVCDILVVGGGGGSGHSLYHNGGGGGGGVLHAVDYTCLLYTSPSPRDRG